MGMKLETKYEILQVLHYMKDNKIATATVKEINIVIRDSLFENTKQSIEYSFSESFYNAPLFKIDWPIFASEELLIEHLKKNY